MQVKNKILIIVLLCLFSLHSCGDDILTPIPPSWDPPQPIDSLLLGSWVLENEYDKIIVTFYEDNDLFIQYQTNQYLSGEEKRNWSTNGDTLIMPFIVNLATNRFLDYTYIVNNDGKQLFVELIKYPYLPGDIPLIGYVPPLKTTKGTFIKIEEN